LDRDTDAAAGFLNTSLQNVANRKFTRRLSRCHRPIPVGQGRKPVDDEQLVEAPEAGDDVERQSVAENILRRIAAQIGKGKDGDGRFGRRRSLIYHRRDR
jgi:hypothetical protein